MIHKIPESYRVGGQEIKVHIVEELNKGRNLGVCCTAAGYIKIARKFSDPDEEQSESSMFNTFIHEWIHSCLDTIGRSDLSEDEQFVHSLAAAVTESILTSKDPL